MNVVRQVEAYKSNQIVTADPGTILLLLYQGAIDALKRAVVFMEAGNMADKGRQILKANDIISEFIASLDFEIGGELAQNLEGLYRFMLEQILLANVQNDPKRIATVVSLLTTLKSGWEEAVALQRKRPIKGAA
jgi:flagellar protein FliS